MTPQARLATAAELLDAIGAGRPAEQALTTWARKNRYAGSKDRAAIRDHVFDVLRRRRSCAALGGGETGRALVIGLLRAQGEDPDAWLTGQGYALPPLTAAERASGAPPEGNAALDIPDWLAPALRESLGAEMPAVAQALRRRAPLFLRWHEGRTTAPGAIAALAEDGIVALPHPLAPTALEVTEGARRLRQGRAWQEGLVEVQDAASQAVCAALPAGPGSRVLDYCAGGGGKALALAARGAELTAHDADRGRMADLPARAARARNAVQIVDTEAFSGLAPFDLVVADVPCSGSGAWRRQVEAKWRLDAATLEDLQRRQAEILDRAAGLVRAGGALAYVTCSLLRAENEDAVAAFLEARPGWRLETERRWSPLEGGDGFFLAFLREHGGT